MDKGRVIFLLSDSSYSRLKRAVSQNMDLSDFSPDLILFVVIEDACSQ